MTGTLAFLASSRTFSCLNARYRMPSTYRLRTRAVSAIVSPRPNCRSFGLRKRACPPSWVIPTSNDTRVRVDDFSKIIARLRPRSGSYGSPAFVRFLMLPASSSRPTRSSRTSRIDTKSRFPAIAGAPSGAAYKTFVQRADLRRSHQITGGRMRCVGIAAPDSVTTPSRRGGCRHAEAKDERGRRGGRSDRAFRRRNGKPLSLLVHVPFHRSRNRGTRPDRGVVRAASTIHTGDHAHSGKVRDDPPKDSARDVHQNPISSPPLPPNCGRDGLAWSYARGLWIP